MNICQRIAASLVLFLAGVSEVQLQQTDNLITGRRPGRISKRRILVIATVIVNNKVDVCSLNAQTAGLFDHRF